jgi:hypothetical protein
MFNAWLYPVGSRQPTAALFGLLPAVENTTDASGTVKKTDENTVTKRTLQFMQGNWRILNRWLR